MLSSLQAQYATGEGFKLAAAKTGFVASEMGGKVGIFKVDGGMLFILKITHQKTVAGHAAKERLALEKALGGLLIESKQHTGSLTDLRESVLHAQQLTLVTETVLSHKLQLGVKTLLLKRTTGPLEGLAVCGSMRDGLGVSGGGSAYDGYRDIPRKKHNTQT
eukprot:1186264-Prorocentrum_minimum.AAC.7